MKRVLARDVPMNVGKAAVFYGWVHSVRKTSRFVFLVLRDSSGLVQVTFRRGNPLYKAASKLRREDVVKVTGRIIKSDVAHLGYEVLPETLEVLSRSKHPLPLDTSGKIGMDLSVCLNYRAVCLRRPENRAIFKIFSEALSAIREYLRETGHIEVITPKIIGFASEGGADLFRVDYFGRDAYLAQSPQLYKEMLSSAFGKVYEIGSFYRAEKSRTTYHLAEFVSVDVEEAFSSMREVMEVLEGLIKHVVRVVDERCGEELGILGHTLPRVDYDFPVISYSEAVDTLRGEGLDVDWGSDLGADEMRVLGKRMEEKFYFIVDWPLKLKPFYTMPGEDGRTARAFDLNFGWLELASGGERIYTKELFLEGLRRNGLNPGSFKPFIDVLEYGMPPHAGFGLGFSRLMLVLTGRRNIREVTLFPRDVDRLTP